MFVGATGVGRVVQRTVELMKEHDTDDVGPFGGIDVATLQRYLNFHYSVSLDLFGAETSTNAANYFAAGPEGPLPGGAPRRRPPAARRHPRRPAWSTARIGEREAPALAGAQRDAARRLRRRLPEGRRPLEPHAGRRRLRAALPHVGFNRAVGDVRRATTSAPTAGSRPRTSGPPACDDWLPTDDDRAHVESLMVGVTSRGRWPAGSRRRRPASTQKPVDFEYVQDVSTPGGDT